MNDLVIERVEEVSEELDVELVKELAEKLGFVLTPTKRPTPITAEFHRTVKGTP